MSVGLEVSSDFRVEYDRRFELVNGGVTDFAADLAEFTAGNDELTQASIDACIEVSERGGKRIRGVLAVTGMEMYNCANPDLMATVAGVIEAKHGAYMLPVDDVMDKSDRRRGGPTAHMMIADKLRRAGVEEDVDHLSAALAINAALTIQHVGQERLAKLPLPAERILLASAALNRHLAMTGIGQSRDMVAPLLPNCSADYVLDTATLKSAYYTFYMPLQVGALLMGAEGRETEQFEGYATNAGLGFQLVDDDLGMFGEYEQIGKSPKLDLIEGKLTFLVLAALRMAANDDERSTIRAALGNPNLSDDHFESVKAIVERSGARDEALSRAAIHVQTAINEIWSGPDRWPDKSKQFLADIAIMAGTKRNA